jgi:menaquinone C8-methyltransferase
MENISELLLNKVSRIMMHWSLRVSPLSRPPVLTAPDTPLLLYVHIPFCEELCPYCSFFKVKFDDQLADAYFAALEKEILGYHKIGFKFDEVYIGGGTPTVMPEHLGKVIRLIRSLWDIKEVSVETNPNHLQSLILKILKDSGVTRLSVGVQTFDDQLLKKLRRFDKYGSGNEVQQRLKDSAGIFDTLNVDMIFNFPEQTAETLERDISIIKDLNIDQATFYPLMSSSSVKDKMIQTLGDHGAENEKKFYKIISDNLLEGYERTSAWCFTRKGNLIDEYIVNRDYYIGVGAGSFSYISGGMFATTFSINQYIDTIDTDVSAMTMGKYFTRKEKLLYTLLMSLFGGRMDLKQTRKNYGKLWFIYLFIELVFLFLSGVVIFKHGSIRVTSKGHYSMVSLMRDFFSLVNNIREQCRRLSNKNNRAA